MTICPLAAWRPVQNHGGNMAAHLGLILHVQEGLGSLQGWFNNPNSQVSSTFWVAKGGALEQYVDADWNAWAQAAGNGQYNSAETEGFHGEALTDAQIQTLAKLYAWGQHVYGWPLQLADSPGQAGFGWHGMGGLSAVIMGHHPGPAASSSSRPRWTAPTCGCGSRRWPSAAGASPWTAPTAPGAPLSAGSSSARKA